MKLLTCFIFLFLIFILIDLNDCGNDKNKGKGKEKRKEKIIEEEHIDPNHAQFLHEQENCHKIQKHNMNILSMGTKIQGVRGSHISNWQQMIDKNTRMISEREQVLAQHLFLQGDIGQGSSGHGTSGQGGSEHGISMDRMPKIPRWETIGSGGKNEENKFDPKDVDQSIIAKLKEMYPHINYTGPEGSHISNWQHKIDKNTREINEREQIVAQLREKIGQGEAGGSGGQTSEEVDNEIGTYVRSMSVQDQLALLQELTGKSVDQIEIKKKEDD